MITFRNVSYFVNNKKILDNITFSVRKGEKVLLCGASGSGKSSIVNLLLSNIKPVSGKIYYDKDDISSFSEKELSNYRQSKVILILQQDDLFDYMSVMDNLLLFYFEEDVKRILRKAGLYHLKERMVSTLSGGERQRIAICKACLSDCETLICDEVTSALDKENASKIISFILGLNENKTVIFISHDPELFKGILHHKIMIENHKIKEDITFMEVKENEGKHILKKQRSLYKISLQNGFKKYSFFSFIINIASILCYLIAFNYNDLSMYAFRKSYSKYFDYDVLFIKDNDNLKENGVDIFPSMQSIFQESKTIINGSIIENVSYYPFHNKNDDNIIVVNDLFASNINADEISSFKIENDYFKETVNNVRIISENNMFSSPCVYYDVEYFYNTYNLSDDEYVLIKEDLYNEDERFTNNPLFSEKKEDKPYLDSKAYDDYLIYEMVFSSLKSIVSYFFVLIVLYSFIVSFLLNVSYLLRDIKQIAIYKSRGHKDMEILLTYFVSVFINHIGLSVISFIKLRFVFAVLLSFFCNSFSILLSYFYISRKPLYNLLKEDNLC